LYAKQDASTAIVELIEKHQWKLLIASLVILDYGMVYLAFRFSYWIRFYSSWAIFQLDVTPSPGTYTLLAFLLTPVWLAFYACFGLYARQNLLRGPRETSLLLNAATAGVFLVMAVDFLRLDLVMARGWLLVSWLGMFLFTSIGRFAVRRGVQALRRGGLFFSPALIVSANPEARCLAEQFERREYSGLKVLGFIDNTARLAPPSTNPLR